MRLIRTKAEIGPDHVLRVPMPSDVSQGEVEVTVVVEREEPKKKPDDRAWDSVDKFLAERGQDEARREGALALAAWGHEELSDVVRALAAFNSPYHAKPEERRAAIDAGFGMLKGHGVTTAALRAERRAEERRSRDRKP